MAEVRDDGKPVPPYIGTPEMKAAVEKIYRLASGTYEHCNLGNEKVMRKVLKEILDISLKALQGDIA